jgi:hypothetical protein
MAQLQRSLDSPISVDHATEGVAVANLGGEEEKVLKVGYCLNLDPATLLVPFGASIDIRDTVDYKVCFTTMVYRCFSDSHSFH